MIDQNEPTPAENDPTPPAEDATSVASAPVDAPEAATETADTDIDVKSDAAADVAPETPPAAPSGPPEPKESEPLVRDGMAWYVLKVASNLEDRVRDAIERKVKIEDLGERIGRVLVPTQKEKRMRAGRATVHYRKLYPGYVFVEMATEPDGSIAENVWFMIKDTTGVSDFISAGGKPSPMAMHEVQEMMASVIKPDEQPTLANLKFKKGDKVKVQEGPFENFEGVVDEINQQKGMVRVIVTIFGRETPIDIEYWQVELV